MVSKRLGTDFSTWDTLDNELLIRGYGAPSKARYGCGTVVFVTDSSGSIDQRTCDMFNTEGIGLMEQARPRQLIYIQCDARVQEYVEIDDPSDLIRPIRGGGGTDFRPVFERVQREGIEPDILIYLTDLEGTFPYETPPYPVIWVTIADHTAPFGDVIRIPKQLS
jgi:predicted metal-dependent peptidase